MVLATRLEPRRRRCRGVGNRCATPRVLALTHRIVLLVVGSALIAGAVAVTLWTQLGPGPLDVFIGAIRSITGLPLTFAVWMTVGALIVVAWLLGRRPGLGTLAAPLMIGPMMQVSLALLDGFVAPDALARRRGVASPGDRCPRHRRRRLDRVRARRRLR